MLEKNKEYTVEITSVSSDGNGVGRIDGFTVFVPYTAAGDRVKIVLEKVKSRFAQARLLEITEPSKDRVNPECKAFGSCGGCRLRHIAYSAEIREKRAVIENAMKRIGGFDSFTLDGITGMRNPSRYRNKMIFHVGKNPPVCGFFAQQSHDIIPIDDCDIGAEENKKIIGAVMEYMRENSGGFIKQIFTRKSFAAGEIMVVLSADEEIPNSNSLVRNLCEADENIVSIITDINRKKVTLWGKDRIEDFLCGVKFTISPDSFFQVNPIQTERLYNKALEFAALTGNETVLDIYCGIGTISLCAAKRAKKVIGVEIVEQAVMDAKENAEINGIKNAEFYADSAENTVPKLIDRGERPEVVILDPPRKGSDERTLGAIVKAAPERIVYVSCNPATLARDAKFLSERGYEIKRARGFDLFPRTSHVETVCLLEHIKR